MHKDWVLSLAINAVRAAFVLLKQWAGVRKKAQAQLEGKTYDEFPARTQAL